MMKEEVLGSKHLDMPRRYYFDHNATTPVSPEALTAMTEALGAVFGNASSIHHYGQAAKQRLEAARRQVASLVNAAPRETVFLSGGTEANNLAIFGSAARHRHAVAAAIEHPAVLNTVARLGCEVTVLPVSRAGVVDPDDFRRALRKDTTLAAVMHVNNETGTVQPVAEIARIARDAGVPLHVDGVQAAGRIPVDLRTLGASYYAVSAHKLYAPKGIGALFVRPGETLEPRQTGGRHERGRRAGTENVPGAVAFGCAAAWAKDNLAHESARLVALRDRLEAGVLARVEGVRINGAGAPRVPNTTNLRFEAIDGEAMVIALDLRGFAVSSGSACSSGAVEPSHVLLAMGLTPEEARSSIRVSLGRDNDQAQVDALIEAIAEAAAHLRRVSPAWRAYV